ncbi:MAG: PilZ domain-containing protein [Caloramator sp.]|nr:PilZ domain-containing protein [Caloramator sp.]
MEGDCVGIENRKYERAKMNCEILYPTLIYNGEQRTFKEEGYLFVLNVSETGICLQSKFFIPIESFVSFYFRVEDNIPFKALIKIKWTNAQNGWYISGGEFISLSLSDIHILRNYINKHK